jgi:hypothetical protein
MDEDCQSLSSNWSSDVDVCGKLVCSHIYPSFGSNSLRVAIVCDSGYEPLVPSESVVGNVNTLPASTLTAQMMTMYLYASCASPKIVSIPPRKLEKNNAVVNPWPVWIGIIRPLSIALHKYNRKKSRRHVTPS